MRGQKSKFVGEGHHLTLHRTSSESTIPTKCDRMDHVLASYILKIISGFLTLLTVNLLGYYSNIHKFG